jgi:hypothetical protein
MAWTTPRTWVVGEIVTAALMNTHVRDNMNAILSAASTLASSVTASSLTSLGTLTALNVDGDGADVNPAGDVDADLITVGVTGTPRLYWDESEDQFAVTKGISLEAGHLQFPASQSASSNANTLDDYEEGTWTPTIQFGGAAVGQTYSTQLGRYTKVGRIVHVNCHTIFTAKGSSTGAVTITGLPFTPLNNEGNRAAAALRPFTISFADFMLGYLDIASTSIFLYETTNAGSNTALDDTNFSNTSDISFSLTYEVA